MARRSVRSELAVPLEVNGETRGVLNMDSDRADAFTTEDQELLQELAVQAAKVIQNTWLYEQLRLKAHLFESLASVSRTINSTLNLDEALQAITLEAGVLMHARMCSLMMLDESPNGSICAPATARAKPTSTNRDWLLATACSASWYAAKNRCRSPTSRSRAVISMSKSRGAKDGSLLSVPLIFAGGRSGH